MNFVAPDFSSPINWSERFAALPHDAYTRGMFFTDLQRDITSAGKPLPNAKSYVSFKTYPLSEYLELVRYAAEAVYPELPPRLAIRKLGQAIYPRFEQT